MTFLHMRLAKTWGRLNGFLHCWEQPRLMSRLQISIWIQLFYSQTPQQHKNSVTRWALLTMFPLCELHPQLMSWSRVNCQTVRLSSISHWATVQHSQRWSSMSLFVSSLSPKTTGHKPQFSLSSFTTQTTKDFVSLLFFSIRRQHTFRIIW